MFELAKKTFLTGIGMAVMTKDMVAQAARELAHTAQVPAEKGQAFVEEAVARAEQARTDLEQTIRQMVEQNLRRANIPTREDLNDLKAQLARIEQMLMERSQQ